MSKEEKDMDDIASSLLEQIEEQIARADSSKLQLSLLACFTPVNKSVLQTVVMAIGVVTELKMHVERRFSVKFLTAPLTLKIPCQFDASICRGTIWLL